jgi:hypothetical protein
VLEPLFAIDEAQAMRDNSFIHKLVMEHEMGELFKVLVLAPQASAEGWLPLGSCAPCACTPCPTLTWAAAPNGLGVNQVSMVIAPSNGTLTYCDPASPESGTPMYRVLILR